MIKRQNAMKMRIYRKQKKKVISRKPVFFKRPREVKRPVKFADPPKVKEVGGAADFLDDDIYSNDGAALKEGEVQASYLTFKHPFTCLIAGPTSSGKTYFTERLLEHRDQMIEPNIDRVIWCYGIHSRQLTKLKDKFPDILMLHKGLPDLDKLAERDTENVRTLIVIDDLMQETRGHVVSNLFSKGAHHMNMSVIYIVQNIFNQNKEMRNIFLNAQYKVLFKSPSDMTQLQQLNSRMYPGHTNFFKSVMEETAKKNCHAYLLLDAHTRTPDDLRVRTDIFPGEDNGVYLPV